MANPAPTINQINAFNATIGTVIDFNIIGGTDLVRSSKIYIYDLSTNNLICTHLYTSTEPIHELPANTDASMEYESGYSSANFVNNQQYYAQIQTFTDINGTQGGSGLSVAKLFWCLPTPTLTFNTIPATISTTSYNPTVVYNSNITSSNVIVPNIVQQYQFNLYTGTGTLVQTSGVIVGNGEQEGDTTAWDLSYNFNGLTVGSSYYFIVSVTTTEGINLTTQSSTFTVSITTPTLGKATVTNDSCNGYISVVSALSGSYSSNITRILVKRKDVADVTGTWLTLYSQPVLHASDMNFTFIDFLNVYGKQYQYALVPVLVQIQSGVVVEIEGGYTVSDKIDSIFDGVYIADQTNVERVKAGVGYGNIDMNQGVGSITPIGSKYPIVITNSQNQYHNGSIRGTIVPNDFYSNGNLSRIDMVNKRDELEQFLTNKRAKIIKDWNGKIWLVMIMSNVNCSFNDNYGMGMVSFSADWLEVGDPTNQQDLYNAGLINVGGV